MPITTKDLNRDVLGDAVADKSRQAYDARTRFSVHQPIPDAAPATHYSYATELAAKKAAQNPAKDILDILAENPKLNAVNCNEHQERHTAALRESWRIEKQMEAERVAGAKISVDGKR